MCWVSVGRTTPRGRVSPEMADPRRVVVVGAASGIGAATAAHFHHRGDHVLAVDRHRHSTPASEYADCDLANPSEIEALVSRIGPDWDVLAHVAGIPGTAPAVDVLTINYLGTRLMVEGCCHRCGAAARSSRWVRPPRWDGSNGRTHWPGFSPHET